MNPQPLHDWLLRVAEIWDAFRLFPRIFMALYAWYTYWTGAWFISLADPSNAQAGYAGIVAGGAVAAIKFYAQTGGSGRGG